LTDRSSATTLTHSFVDECVSQLARAPLSSAMFGTLWGIERGRRFLLLRSLHSMAERMDSTVRTRFERNWEQLLRLQATHPDETDSVILDPCVGRWLAQTASQLRAGGGSSTVVAATDHLASVVAAIAVRSRQQFSVSMPVYGDHVALPTVGNVHVGTHDLVELEGADGHVHAGGALVADRELVAESEGLTVCIRLADRDPFRPATALDVPGLTDEQHDRWQSVFSKAWELLVRDHAEYAVEIQAGYRSITPLPFYELYRVRSTSSSDAFGGAEISYTDDPAQLAAALIHELQHSKLNALMQLAPLSAGSNASVHRAPWRDDPRPLGGIIHGIFAFTGVCDFWRVRCDIGGVQERRLAQFEYELWHQNVLETIETARSTNELTAVGHRLIEDIETRTLNWSAPVDDEIRASVRGLLIRERAMWRAHHWQPDLDGADDPLSSNPTVVRNNDACRLDAVGVVERIRLVEPDRYTQLIADPERLLATVDGLREVDIIERLDPANAERILMQRIEHDADPRALVALAGIAERPLQDRLHERPDVVLALCRTRTSKPVQTLLDFIADETLQMTPQPA
jgi:HEXXH motif-containing protein